MAVVGITGVASWNVYKAVGLTRVASWDVDLEEPATDVVYDDGRCGPFSLVNVDYMVEGVSRVSWFMREGFAVALPATFQLQVGNTGWHLSDDWVDVGPELTDTYQATDAERRAFGKQLTVHYRIKMVDAGGVTYYSQPASALGHLGVRDYIFVRDIIRKWKLRNKNFAGTNGYLLKRRRNGTPCTRCLDPNTNEVLEGNCPVCNGTRFILGYYRPVPETYAATENETIQEELTNEPSGWSLPTAITAMFLANPLLSTGDLWVTDGSDLRYYIQKITVKAQVRGVPVLSEVVLRALPFNHVAYKIPLEVV